MLQRMTKSLLMWGFCFMVMTQWAGNRGKCLSPWVQDSRAARDTMCMATPRQPRDATSCGAKTKGDPRRRCSRPAGWGTDHPGVGQCKLHGGVGPIGNRNAARPSLNLLVGMTVDISPMDALLTCVRIKAGEVAYYSYRISELTEEEVTVRPSEQVMAGKDPGKYWIKKQEAANLWIKLRDDALMWLARYSKMALDAGVEERLITVAEGMGDRLATALESILNELQLTPAQMAKAPAAIRQQLYALEGKVA